MDEMFKRQHRKELEIANMNFKDWLVYMKSLNHITLLAEHTLLNIRTFLLDKQLTEDEMFKLGLAGTETDIVVGFHAGFGNMRLYLDVLEFLHVPYNKYELCSLYSVHTNIQFWDFVGLIIPEECYHRQSYQANLM